jgi:predicted GNAT family acetyltransferase
MYVTRHSDPDAFLAAAAPMRARGEASASFHEGWAHGMKRTPPEPGERVYLATVAGRGAAIQRDEGPVVVGQSEPRAAAAFADDLAREWPGLQGVVGSKLGCMAFAQRWRERTGRGCALRVHMRQHALRAVADVPAARGTPRVAVGDDLRWLLDAQVAFIAEAGIPDSPDKVETWLPRRIARGEFRVWEDDAPVAYAGFNDAAPDFARIAPVYTFPDRRSRGYATALVASLSRELLARGKRRLFLTTDVSNRTSNGIYARIGYVAESDEFHYDFVAGAA